MAMNEKDLKPNVRKNVHNFLMALQQTSWPWDHGDEILQIIINQLLTWLILETS